MVFIKFINLIQFLLVKNVKCGFVSCFNIWVFLFDLSFLQKRQTSQKGSWFRRRIWRRRRKISSRRWNTKFPSISSSCRRRKTWLSRNRKQSSNKRNGKDVKRFKPGKFDKERNPKDGEKAWKSTVTSCPLSLHAWAKRKERARKGATRKTRIRVKRTRLRIRKRKARSFKDQKAKGRTRVLALDNKRVNHPRSRPYLLNSWR